MFAIRKKWILSFWKSLFMFRRQSFHEKAYSVFLVILFMFHDQNLRMQFSPGKTHYLRCRKCSTEYTHFPLPNDDFHGENPTKLYDSPLKTRCARGSDSSSRNMQFPHGKTHYWRCWKYNTERTCFPLSIDDFLSRKLR